MVTAGLQCDVGSCPPRSFPRIPQGEYLCVCFTCALVIAAPHDPVTFCNHATDPWVGMRCVHTPSGQLQGFGHALVIKNAETHGLGRLVRFAGTCNRSPWR